LEIYNVLPRDHVLSSDQDINLFLFGVGNIQTHTSCLMLKYFSSCVINLNQPNFM